MSYEDSFAAVPGVTIEWYEEFGSYQGRMVCKISKAGEAAPQYIIDYYGSCSGCDSFQAEFGWGKDRTPENLAAFGQSYVDASMSLEQAIDSLIAKKGGWQDQEELGMAKRILQDYPDYAGTGPFSRLQ